jgi:hypothetical protein
VNANEVLGEVSRDAQALEAEEPALLGLLQASHHPAREARPLPAAPGTAVVVGELLALAHEDRATALVRFPGQTGTAAARARTIVNLHGFDIGAAIALAFEDGDCERPIVLGVIRGRPGWPSDATPPQLEVDSDGQRITVSAREQLVLRCGEASITLTKAGKVLIEGTYVSSRSSGVNRIKGGSVQLN